MKRMGGADAFMLSTETSRAYQHTFKIAIIDPSTDPEGWSFDKYYRDIESRLHLIPPYRWKVAPAPLGLGHPYWVDDPDFNLAYHLRRIACPAPGDHKALCELMSQLYAYKLDRDRPLWTQWVIEGLEGGKVALVMIVHHAYVDGVGAGWLMKRFYQPLPEDHRENFPAWNPEPYPSWFRRFATSLRDLPGFLINNLPKVVSGLRKKRAMDQREKLSGKPAHPDFSQMKKTPINVVLSAGRTFVCDTVPLGRLIRISKHFKVTINDVFGACAAGAVRNLLLSMDFNADAHPLIAGTPFAGVRPEGMEGLGNFASADFCWFHTEIADPIQRLMATREANIEMKQHMAEVKEAGADISALINILPNWAIRLLTYLIKRKKGGVGFFGNLALSNVPGPKEDLFLDKWKVENWFSTGQIFDGTALNMTLWSYAGKANLCILTDRAVLADGWILFNYFVKEIDVLEALIDKTEQSPEVTK
jgi:WS/DGAT/MGAT family acyltransferase